MTELVTLYGSRTKKAGIQISVVVPLYNVERYLPDLLNSFASQEAGDYIVEYIFVDDGSPDNSKELTHDWFQRTGNYGIVIEKENGGVSSARNRGLASASGEWVIFPDSDDFLAADFFAKSAKFLKQSRIMGVNLVANNLWRYMDDTEKMQNTHALRFRFAGRSKVVDLTNSPHYIHLHAASTFFRRSFLLDNELIFDSRIHASEDALFVAHVLAASSTPKMGISVESRYYYRKRATGDSAVDTFRSKPETYFDRFELGYLELFERCIGDTGAVPEWLQNLVLYEFKWIFDYELAVKTKESVLGSQGRQRFIDMVSRILHHVAEEAIWGYRATRMSFEIRLLLLAVKNGSIPRQPIYVTSLDKQRNCMTLKYYFTGELPREEFRVRAKAVEPTAAKIRTLDYFDQRILFERIVELPANSWLAVDLDGIRAELRLGVPTVSDFALTEKVIERNFQRFDLDYNNSRRVQVYGTEASESKNLSKLSGFRQRIRKAMHVLFEPESRSKPDEDLSSLSFEELRNLSSEHVGMLRRLAWSDGSISRYGDAWVFIDRLMQAQDNAEHMYRWVRENHPEIRIFYVIKREASDWQRLERDGFNLIEFGSLEHYLVMLNASVQLSSHADYEMFQPIPERYYINSVRSWRYVFLQHGITKDNISLWLNSKNFDLFITVTKPEHESICGDYTPYKFTTMTVKRTGFPRYDALLSKVTGKRKERLLIAPTWRESLMKPKASFVGKRELIDDIEESQFFQCWQELLHSSDLAQYAEDKNLQITLLPHPHMVPLLELFDLPNYVELASYEGDDVQWLFATASVTITDYSSVAFDARIAGSRILYYQFDKETLHGNGHTMREGYFTYDRDGLGPTFSQSSALIDWLSSSRPDSWEVYDRRFDALEIAADGKSCQRVYEEVLTILAPIPKV